MTANNCAEVVGYDFEQQLDYGSTLDAIALHHIKLEVDVWVVKYDCLLKKFARKAEQAAKAKDLAEDIKSELIIEAYNAALNRYDPLLGVPLGAFLVSTLRFYMASRWRMRRYMRHETETCSVAHTGSNKDYHSERADSVHVQDKHEISSLERSANVSSLLEGLSETDRLMLYLHYDMGYHCKFIDQMLGCSHSTTWHKIQRIIRNIQSKCKCDG